MTNDLGAGLEAARRYSQTSNQCGGHILYMEETLQEGVIDYEHCLLSCEARCLVISSVALQLSQVMRHVCMCWHRWARMQRKCTAFCCSSWESDTWNGARNPCLSIWTLFRLSWESSWNKMQVDVMPLMDYLKMKGLWMTGVKKKHKQSPEMPVGVRYFKWLHLS